MQIVLYKDDPERNSPMLAVYRATTSISNLRLFWHLWQARNPHQVRILKIEQSGVHSHFEGKSCWILQEDQLPHCAIRIAWMNRCNTGLQGLSFLSLMLSLFLVVPGRGRELRHTLNVWDFAWLTKTASGSKVWHHLRWVWEEPTY